MRIAFTLSLLLAAGGCRTDVSSATRDAEEYSRNFPGVTGLDCARADSDGDGYVTCTLFRGANDPLQIQCGSERLCLWNCARGCKYVPAMRMEGHR
jgi:hypothetical protein